MPYSIYSTHPNRHGWIVYRPLYQTLLSGFSGPPTVFSVDVYIIADLYSSLQTKKVFTQLKKIPQTGDFYFGIYFFLGKRTAAWAAAKRAIGTRNGEQDTELNPT